MSDQTEKPKGALPKGYEPNAQGESQDQDKKIWDKYYNGEIELPDVVKELKRYRSSEDTELETSDEDQRGKDLKEYEPNAQGESQDQDKKIWDKYYNGEIELPNVVKELKHYRSRKDTELETSDEDQREKDLKEYESSYLTRVKKDKPEKSSDDFRVELGISTESDVDLGRLNLRKHVNVKRKAKQEEIKEYEKKYLARYKKPKAKSKRSFSLKSDVDTGTLTLGQYVNAKRKTKQDEIKKYEQKYLSRYKQPKLKKKASSSLYKPEIPKPKRNMKKERKEYEQKYLSRYKQPKANLRKPLNLKSDDLGRLNLRKHTIAKRSEYLAKRKDYEEKYISRYMKKRKAEPKRSSSKNLDHDLISGRLDLRAFVDKKRHEIKTERTEYEKKYISKYKESKASIKKSKSLTESDDLGKFTISTKTTALKKLRAERAEYEKQYLVRYSKQRKAKPKKKVASSDLYKPEIPKPKRDMKKERKEYEQKYLARHLKQRKTKPKKKK
ncbi:MAG: hypothetical protein NZ803_02370 [Candidatus Nitrosopelagicus sp.]|nr:hypothetical protein [Candidatus Nitrosopelagicus sp.]